MMKKENNCKKLVNPLCLDLLISFSDTDISNCENILTCKYFNTDKYLIKLYQLLVKQLISLKRVYTNDLKTLIYNEVFDATKTVSILSKEQDNKLRVKYSELTKILLKYLSIEALKKNYAYEDDLILKELLNKKQFKLIQRKVNSSTKRLQKSLYKSSDFYRNYFILEESAQMMNRFTGNPFQKEKLETINKHLDTVYLIDKLKTQLTLLTEQKASINSYDYSSMNAISKLMDLPEYKNNNSIKIYGTAVELTKKPTEKKYYQLLDLLSSFPNQLPKVETESLYYVASNFCIKQIHYGNFGYKNLFDLYQLMHLNGFLIRDNYINENILKNIVTVSCHTKQFAWAEELIETCFPYLTKSIRVSVRNYNLGNLSFFQEQYEKAHNFFSKVQPINLNYDINNRVMLAKTFYETDEYYDLPTYTHFNSEQRFFDRINHLRKSTSKAYKNFFVILKELYRIKHGISRKSIEQLKMKLDKMSSVTTKDWLLEKMKELEQHE